MLEEQKEKLESKLTEASRNNRVALRELRELKARFLQQYQKEKLILFVLSTMKNFSSSTGSNIFVINN